MTTKSATPLHVLLLLSVLWTLCYCLACASALREKFFHRSRYSRRAFNTADDAATPKGLKPEGRKALLESGDLLRGVNGAAYTGQAQLDRLERECLPGSLVSF